MWKRHRGRGGPTREEVASGTVTCQLPMLMVGFGLWGSKASSPKELLAITQSGYSIELQIQQQHHSVDDEVMIRCLKTFSKIGTKALICQWSCQGCFCNQLESDDVFVHANMKSFVKTSNPVQDAYCTFQLQHSQKKHLDSATGHRP